MKVLGSFVKNQVTVDVWIYVLVFHSVPLVFMSVLGPVPCCFYCYGSVEQFEVRYGDTSSVAFLFRIVLAIPGLLCLHTKFRIDFSVCEECHWNFDGVCIERIDCF
jgi:hypothetical protein